ncbi:hypothetical protein [Streptosporangium sp. CA-115845]|uniref:hypothetical protein n=1 Tax=Streptosporangium sp. CA-115845 TaxID=3240071 RepID=UPI003D908920
MQTKEWYGELAQVFRGAVDSGQPPAKAVERRFGLAKSTATRRISEARKLGILPSGHGHLEQRNPKALAVANALDVTYEDLVRAVHEHAGGDLRIARDAPNA